jgi:hypothetical protein
VIEEPHWRRRSPLGAVEPWEKKHAYCQLHNVGNCCDTNVLTSFSFFTVDVSKCIRGLADVSRSLQWLLDSQRTFLFLQYNALQYGGQYLCHTVAWTLTINAWYAYFFESRATNSAIFYRHYRWLTTWRQFLQ